MSEVFIPLARFLRPTVEDSTHESLPAVPPPDVPEAPTGTEHDDAFRAVRRFRAALADVLDTAVQTLLPAIARDVLARELRLEPADIAAVVRNAIDRFGGDQVLSIRANPADLDALGVTGLPRLSDDTLPVGDILIELRSGTIDLTLVARLNAALAAWAA